ncbi:hypothetical protein [Streptomyces atratus]|uniref:hypothetical protein n=1 Tax=Streptomyces TaxID=1883 RepID=UPI0037AA7998
MANGQDDVRMTLRVSHDSGEIPAWHTAPAEGITAFAAANANVWSEISTADPDPWTLRLATAATAWHAHRRTA